MKLLGVDIADVKSLHYGLMDVRGIGPYVAKKLVKDLDLGNVGKIGELTVEQQATIWRYVRERNIKVEQELMMMVKNNMLRQIKLGTYRGSRYLKKLPVRGQRTSTNAKSCKLTKHYSS